MEPTPAPAGSAERFAAAREAIDASTARITTALGSIVALADKPIHISQPLWRRTTVFAEADLRGVLSESAQAEIARLLRVLISARHWLDNARWEAGVGRVSTQPEVPADEILTGHDGATRIVTTIPAIDLLAVVFSDVAGAVESLTTRLTARQLIQAPIPASEPAYLREIEGMIARVSTRPDTAWVWEIRHDHEA